MKCNLNSNFRVPYHCFRLSISDLSKLSRNSATVNLSAFASLSMLNLIFAEVRVEIILSFLSITSVVYTVRIQGAREMLDYFINIAK